MFGSGSSRGGTQADHRFYLGLKNSNLLETYEYSDFPVITVTFEVKTDHHIAGDVINIYLKAYATEFSIADKIRIRTKIVVADTKTRPKQNGS